MTIWVDACTHDDDYGVPVHFYFRQVVSLHFSLSVLSAFLRVLCHLIP